MSTAFPSQPFVFMGILCLGILAAMILAYKQIATSMYMTMFATGGLIGALMASFSINAQSTQPWTMDAVGTPALVTIGLFIAIVVIGYFMSKYSTAAPASASV